MLDFGFGSAESGEAGEDAIRDLGLGLELSVAFKLAFSGEFGAVEREMAGAQDKRRAEREDLALHAGDWGDSMPQGISILSIGEMRNIAHTVQLGAEAKR